MNNVVIYATIIACTSYAIAGFFGYATFALNDNVKSIMEEENIFEAPYNKNSWILAAKLLLLAGVMLASPLCLMPTKDTIEELYLGPGKTMNKLQNLIVTLIVVTTCFVFAVAIPNISDAMTVIGATSNPLVGFTLPCVYYLKMDTVRNGEQPWYTPHRLLAHVVNVLCIATGIISLALFIKNKVNPKED